ncbi:TcfC E-set like domain-containing protein [Vibrio cholerae]|uniref:TcfC E-set like domain-containing protein n=1 Tax=Vibrio cholerae TaxID=666 RepID=UPI0009B2B832|nr:TcfC E-set like domain-containing protein [Vibrio cholerae]
MIKTRDLILLCAISPSLMASDYKLPAGFEYILENGVEIDVLFNSDREDADMRRVARMKNTDNTYKLSYLSPDFMNGVKSEFKTVLESLMQSGIPENGIYCHDAARFGLPKSCAPDELLVSLKYDTKKLLATLYLSPSFLEMNEMERKAETLYLGKSSTQDEITAIANYELYSSNDSSSLRNHLSANTIISQGDQNVTLGGYAVVDERKNGVGSTSSSNSNTQKLTQAAWSQNTNGIQKSVGLMKGHNISSSVFGSSRDMIGVSYGTSNATKLRTSRQSDIDVVVLIPADGRVESYRDGRLINTQFLAQGVQTLDTTAFPDGVYEIELKIFQDQQLFSTQKSYIYKSALLNDRQYKVWAGTAFDKNQLTGDWVVGGVLADKINPQTDYNLKGTLTKNQLATEASLTRDVGLGALRSGVALDTDGNKAANLSLGMRLGDVSTNHRISWSDRQSENVSTSHSAFWRVTPTTDLNANLTQRWQNQGNDMMASLGVNQRLDKGWVKDWYITADYTYTEKEDLWGLNLQIPLTTNVRSYVKQNRHNTSAGLNYNYADSQSMVRHASLSADKSFGDNEEASARGYLSFEGDYLSGNAGASWTQNNTSSYSRSNSSQFANLSGSVYLPGGLTSQQQNSAILINVDPQDVGKLKALTPSGDIMLNKPQNLVPVSAYSTNRITVDVAEESGQLYQVENASHSITTYPGNIKKVQVKANPIFTVTGRLVDKQGQPLAYQNVLNHLGASFTSDDGVFTLEVSSRNPSLTWLNCEYDLSAKLANTSQPYLFLGDLTACDALLNNPNLRLAGQPVSEAQSGSSAVNAASSKPHKLLVKQVKQEQAKQKTVQPKLSRAIAKTKEKAKPQPATGKIKYAVQYASLSPQLTEQNRVWLNNILQQHRGELSLKYKNNGRLVLISECSTAACDINPEILQTLNRNDAFKTRYIEGENYIDYPLERVLNEQS